MLSHISGHQKVCHILSPACEHHQLLLLSTRTARHVLTGSSAAAIRLQCYQEAHHPAGESNNLWPAVEA